jgi:hypothetical protein
MVYYNPLVAGLFVGLGVLGYAYFRLAGRKLETGSTLQSAA